jgi:hypothetical protein
VVLTGQQLAGMIPKVQLNGMIGPISTTTVVSPGE